VHYLDGNRFEWWFLEQRGLVPPTEAITLNNGLSPPASYHSREDRLYEEFRSPFSAVMGSRLDDIPNRPGRADARVEFKLLTRQVGFPVPVSLPLNGFAATAVDTAVFQNQVSNAAYVGHWPSPTDDIIISFAVAQRAVGLEYGVSRTAAAGASSDRYLSSDSIRLVAYDEQGNWIVESAPYDMVGPSSRWQTNRSYPIGVRDQAGGIRSVVLTLQSADVDTNECLFILRIWHEPLPPIAIFQAQFEFGINNAVRLPFRCDRAVAFLRGFKAYFSDPDNPRPIKRILIDMNPGLL